MSAFVSLMVLPNLYVPGTKLFGLIPVEPFGALVGLALIVGYWLGRRRARQVGLDPEITADAMVWAVVVGFIMAHLVSAIFYFPERVKQEPLSLLYIWNGISSFGGFIGGIAGVVYYLRRHGQPIMPYAEAILFGLVPAWIIGRLGCTIAFDHPGVPSDFFLAMYDRAGVARHNLGCYEMLYSIVLTVALYGSRKVRRFDGFHAALMLLLYTPVRFAFDFLRQGDETYAGLTPGQYLSGVGFVLGLVLMVRAWRARQRAPLTAS